MLLERAITNGMEGAGYLYTEQWLEDAVSTEKEVGGNAVLGRSE